MNKNVQDSISRLYIPSDKGSNINGEAGDSENGYLSQADKRKVSPAPVSRFATKLGHGYSLKHGMSLHKNRVSLPLARQQTYNGSLFNPIARDVMKRPCNGEIDLTSGLFNGLKKKKVQEKTLN